ncbi:hypothetical protein PAXINDRAFT_159296, partial [Paxillus involutus ATCC 200175]
TEGAGDADTALRRLNEVPFTQVPRAPYTRTRKVLTTSRAEVADGCEECTKAIYADYRVRSRIFDVSTRPGGVSMKTFNYEELKMMIDTAHQYGVKVAAHATNNDTIIQLVQLSVDSIEHGYDIASNISAEPSAREPLRTLAQSNTKWVPSLAAYFTMNRGSGGPWERAAQSFQATLEEGLDNISCGGDTGAFAHGDNALELIVNGETGNRLEESSEMGSMDWEGQKGNERLASVGDLKEDPNIVGDNEVSFGAVRRGFIADLIATSGDFATDFQGAVSADSIKFVMKGGKVYKRDGIALV